MALRLPPSARMTDRLALAPLGPFVLGAEDEPSVVRMLGK